MPFLPMPREGVAARMRVREGRDFDVGGGIVDAVVFDVCVDGVESVIVRRRISEEEVLAVGQGRLLSCYAVNVQKLSEL